MRWDSSAHHLLATGATWPGHGSFQRCGDGGRRPRGAIPAAPRCDPRLPHGPRAAQPRRRVGGMRLRAGAAGRGGFPCGFCSPVPASPPEGRKPPLNVTWECGMLSRRSGLLRGGGLGPHGAGPLRLAQPLDGCICWQLKKKEEMEQFSASLEGEAQRGGNSSCLPCSAPPW